VDVWGQLRIVAEVVGAMALGGLVGFERAAADKPAGFRTNMIVAGAAALIVGLGHALLGEFTDLHGDAIRADPFRLLGAVFTGVSFLGAGTIIRRGPGGGVAGITTGATLLLTASIGVAVALRQYIVAVAVTLLALAVLRGARHLERRLLQATGRSEDEADES
jgi:putative Mg2+ transporter-C (MgtC) family protein